LPDQAAIPAVPGGRLISAPQAAGFELTLSAAATTGSSIPTAGRPSVAVHGNKDVPKGTHRAILRDCGLIGSSFATCSDPATAALALPWPCSIGGIATR
jgi:predicted RNA binding protein YcfA (HicA-like mRNA interferase family)